MNCLGCEYPIPDGRKQCPVCGWRAGERVTALQREKRIAALEAENARLRERIQVWRNLSSNSIRGGCFYPYMDCPAQITCTRCGKKKFKEEMVKDAEVGL